MFGSFLGLDSPKKTYVPAVKLRWPQAQQPHPKVRPPSPQAAAVTWGPPGDPGDPPQNRTTGDAGCITLELCFIRFITIVDDGEF